MNLKQNRIFKRLKHTALDIFYPQSCIMCGCFVNISREYSLCRDCMEKMTVSGKTVRDTDRYFEEADCALKYADYVKDSMTEYKFKGICYLYKTFAYAVFEKIKHREFLKTADLICPVPIHPSRDREYNQSQLIAEHISHLSGIECVGDLLIKIKNTSPLSKLGYAKRKHLIKNAVAFNIQYNIEGKTICLVDDIYTTGSTSNECARILRMYGAKKVYVLSACYAEDKTQGDEENANTNIGNN